MRGWRWWEKARYENDGGQPGSDRPLYTCGQGDDKTSRLKRQTTATTKDKRQFTQTTTRPGRHNDDDSDDDKGKDDPSPSLITPNNVPPLRQTKRRSVGKISRRPSLFISEHAASSHRSILEYLHSNGFADSFKSLALETGINHTPDPKSKYNGLLEKKWTSVIRLQKKVCYSSPFASLTLLDRGDCSQIMDLENRNASLQEEVSMSPAKRAALQTDWVPRAPAAYTLTGHRDQVLRVAFHPSYNIIASASDDSTVKIWDWETGEFERTLKGHTRSVNDVDFDSKGNLLGEFRLLRTPSLGSRSDQVTCSSDLFIKVWDTQNDWKNVKTMAGHDHTVSSARFMPGDQFIVSASRDRTIRVFDISSTFVLRSVSVADFLTRLMVRHLVRTISGHSDWVRYVEPSIDGKLLVSGSNDQVRSVPLLTVHTLKPYRPHACGTR